MLLKSSKVLYFIHAFYEVLMALCFQEGLCSTLNIEVTIGYPALGALFQILFVVKGKHCKQIVQCQISFIRPRTYK